MSQDEKRIKFRVGRPVQVDNVQYGVGEYSVTPAVAEALKRKNAGAAVDAHIAAARSSNIAGESGSTAEFGDKPDASVQRTDANPNNPLSKPLAADSTGINPGGGATGGGGEGGEGGAGGGSATGSVENLSGELPSDFPQREKLTGAGVVRYEQLTALTSAQLTAIGIDEAGVQELSTRLYEDAQKSQG